MRRAEVVLRDALFSFDRLFSYVVPEEAPEAFSVGFRVMVPFGRGNRLREAYVVALHEGECSTIELKTIEAFPDTQAVFLPTQIQLAYEMKRRYACTWGAALKLMLPSLSMQVFEEVFLTDEGKSAFEQKTLPGEEAILFSYLKDKRRKQIRLEDLLKLHPEATHILKRWIEEGWVEQRSSFKTKMRSRQEDYLRLRDRQEAIDLLESNQLRSVHQVDVLELLLEYEEITLSECMAAASCSRAVLKNMVARGWLLLEKRNRAPAEPLPGDWEVAQEPLPFTPQQDLAYQQLFHLWKEEPSPEKRLKEALLFGITGSGKTELYLQLAAEVLQSGQSVIFLVPEISLTPQMAARVRARFGSNLAILHSRLTPRERFEEWRRIREGKAKIVLGPRSALFAPVQNLGLILVDEEQEDSYLADTHPRYDARTVARLRAVLEQAVLLLGSATPSVSSFYRSQTGKSLLLCLNERPGLAVPPEVDLVDMRKEAQQGNYGPLSVPLVSACREAFSRGEQAIILLNRRGYGHHLLCQECGYTPICPRCSLHLTYHREGDRLICHICGYTEKKTKHCPHCGGQHYQSMGLGTQQIEEALHEQFPERRIVRMDRDTTAKRRSHEELLKLFRDGEADILLGTQMVAKGHDYPNVTVVGILAAEKSLYSLDYRAGERAFQLFTQAAGRAGRSQKKGKVFLQSWNPEEPILLHAANQAYLPFYQDEIRFRELFRYPPRECLLQLTASAPSEERVRQFFDQLHFDLAERFGREGSIQVQDPVKAPLLKMYHRYYYQMLLRSSSLEKLIRVEHFLARLQMQEQLRLSWRLDPA